MYDPQVSTFDQSVVARQNLLRSHLSLSPFCAFSSQVYVRLDPIALRDNISSLLQVLLRQRTKSGTKNSSLLTDDASACATALANRVVNIVATCIHARESGKECEDGCCAATMALPRLLAELALSCGPVQATTLSGAKRRFVPVLSLNGGDCGIPTGWDKDREEAAAEARSLEAALKEDSSSPIRCRPVAPSLRCAPQALKSGKPALPLVDVTAEAAISTQVSSWWCEAPPKRRARLSRRRIPAPRPSHAAAEPCAG